MNVLIADDDLELVEYLKLYLEIQGCRVSLAYDAVEALNSGLVETPDVIILDVEMPSGGGRRALKNLKLMNATADIPVVVLSGSTDPYTAHTMQTLGASDYVSKPVLPENLYEVLCRHAA